MILLIIAAILFILAFLLQFGIYKGTRRKSAMLFLPVASAVIILPVLIMYGNSSILSAEGGYVLIAYSFGLPVLSGSVIGGLITVTSDDARQYTKKKETADKADKFERSGFKCETFQINVRSDGKTHSHTMLKTIVGENTEDNLNIFRLCVRIDERKYMNTRNFEHMKMAIVDLQKQLPDNLQILCCQTCRYGNYNPFRDNDNEIFCLIEHTINSKSDLADLIIDNPRDAFAVNKLTHWCEKYEKINSDYYTYNEWTSHFKDN